MPHPDSDSPSPPPPRLRLQDQQLARLRSEVRTPYRGLRQFIYLACGGSALIGGLVFFTQLFAGAPTQETLLNLGLQVGVLVLMIGLFRLDQPQPPK